MVVKHENKGKANLTEVKKPKSDKDQIQEDKEDDKK